MTTMEIAIKTCWTLSLLGILVGFLFYDAYDFLRIYPSWRAYVSNGAIIFSLISAAIGLFLWIWS